MKWQDELALQASDTEKDLINQTLDKGYKTMTTYKLEQNKKYGDWRVEQFVDGEWENEFDNNWSKLEAQKEMAFLINLESN